MRDDRGRLTDILAAIDKILTKTPAGRAAFEADEMLQVWFTTTSKSPPM